MSGFGHLLSVEEDGFMITVQIKRMVIYHDSTIVKELLTHFFMKIH
jgi:hypothetical protein